MWFASFSKKDRRELGFNAKLTQCVSIYKVGEHNIVDYMCMCVMSSSV